MSTKKESIVDVSKLTSTAAGSANTGATGAATGTSGSASASASQQQTTGQVTTGAATQQATTSQQATASQQQASAQPATPKAASKAPAAASQKPCMTEEERVKMVKTMKNQFAINRLVMMFMDVKPDDIDPDSVEDLKKVYALLVHIHSHY